MSKYRIEKTNKFKRDYNRMKIRKNFDKKEFINVIKLLADGKVLPQKYCNHILEPKSNGLWECHIKPDWILIYMIEKKKLILILTRMGTHSDLFK